MYNHRRKSLNVIQDLLSLITFFSDEVDGWRISEILKILWTEDILGGIFLVNSFL